MRYQAVFYDLDGTLVDSVPVILETFQKTFIDVIGHEEDEDFILSTIGRPLVQAFETYPEPLRDTLYQTFKQKNEQMLDAIVAFDGILNMLCDAAKHVECQGVITSKRRGPAAYTIKNQGFDPYFSCLVTREDTKRHKPDPEPLYYAMEKSGLVDPKRILYVGDTVFDIACAQAAGADAACVDWTYMPKDDLRALAPTYWLNRPEDLSCILGARAL